MTTKRQLLVSTSGRLSKRPKPTQSDTFLAGRKALPIWNHKGPIQDAVAKKDVLIVVGETGSGKSTQIPQFLFQEDWCQKKTVKVRAVDGSESEVVVGGVIAITQPRRVAATTLAHRVAQEAGTPLKSSAKGLVGYSVRFDHVVPRGTKIKFLTEGMLLQELINDPNFRQYSAIVVDEIHERSVDVDLLCGFLKQVLQGDMSGRGGIPLKVVIMSATADIDALNKFFGHDSEISVEILRVEGRQHPVTVIHSPVPVPRPDVQQELVKRIFQLNQTEPLPGDILAFMTGQEEIESTQKLLEEEARSLGKEIPRIVVFPLYGQLPIEAQKEAFQPVHQSMMRKVVLATNIAETSVTVPGVRYVVDCGDAKVKLFRSALNIESLLPLPISKSSVTQRTGRAGREAPGKCYRLYTEKQFTQFHDVDLPEILRVDVVGAVLMMKARGINDIFSFPLMDPPDSDSVKQALIQLHIMGALSKQTGEITEMGRQMTKFPVSVSLARALIAAAAPSNDCLLEAIDIVSCLTSGESIFFRVRSEEEAEDVEELRKQLYRREGDLLTYLMTIQAYTAEHADRVEWCQKRRINVRQMRQALKIRKQLRYLCLGEKMLSEVPRDPQPFVPLSPERGEVLLKCFLKGFALKTALLAPDKSYVTSQGRHVVAVHPSSVLKHRKKEAIMYMDHIVTQRSYAKKVSAIQAQWIFDSLDDSK